MIFAVVYITLAILVRKLYSFENLKFNRSNPIDSQIDIYEIDYEKLPTDRKLIVIPKCCLPDQTFIHEHGSDSCVKASKLWNPAIFSKPEEKLFCNNESNQNVTIRFKTIGLPNCSYTVLHNRPDLWFNILQDGTAAVGLNFWTVPVWLKPLEGRGYCLDALTGTDIDDEKDSVLVFCELEDFQLYITIRVLFGAVFVISAGSVFITMVIYLIIWDQQSVHGWTQFSFFLSLFLFYCSEGSRIFAKYNGLKIKPTTTCFVHALIAHYFTLVLSGTGCMMSLDCFITFWKLRSVMSKTKRELAFYLFTSWGIPVLALALGLYLHFHNNSEETEKEISGVFKYAHYRCSSPVWEFAFRVQITLLLLNLMSFIGTTYLIIKHFRATSMVNKSRNPSDNRYLQLKRTMKLSMKLFLIMGISWILSAVDLIYGYKEPMGWIFVIIRLSTSLQGVVHLIIFGLPRKNFVKIGKKYPKLQDFCWLFKPKTRETGISSDRNSSTKAYIVNRIYSITSQFRSS